MEARRMCFLFLFLLSAHVGAQEKTVPPLVPALYIFGDSSVDPGNNNCFVTIVKANFPPYGRDFVDHKPTGRFTNGKLATDILSSLVGLPDTIPAYLDPEFQGERILAGASFASSASGYDDGTARTYNVLNLGQQIELFKQYKVRVAEIVGKENASNIVSQALFGVATGTDDFANNYFINPLTYHKYSIEEYEDLLLRSVSQFIENIYEVGGRKIAVLGLPPIGCLPSQITVHRLLSNTCAEEENEAAISFNRKLSTLLQSTSFPGLKLAYIDIHDKLLDAIRNPTKYGFEETRKACCGTGLIETALLCNALSPTCVDSSKYVFWDSFHPTETMLQILAQDIFRQAISSNLM